MKKEKELSSEFYFYGFNFSVFEMYVILKENVDFFIFFFFF